MYLLTRNPAIKSLKDFTAKDKIAVPTIKVSSQATILQMAAEQEFGEGKAGHVEGIDEAVTEYDCTVTEILKNGFPLYSVVRAASVIV